MVIITNYDLTNKAVFLFVESREPSYCPVCGEALLMRSTRQRTLYDSSGTKGKLVIRRLYCNSCNRIHHELPDCIVPYKRHCAETITNIIQGNKNVTCENRTIVRILAWWAAVQLYFMNILKTLAEKYSAKFKTPPVIREIVRAVVNSNNWVFAHQVCTRSVSLSG